MIGFVVMLAALSEGPDLAEMDKAVGRCDGKAIARVFADEPARRRSFLVSAFAEQQAIVAARRALAERRLSTAPAATGGAPNLAAMSFEIAQIDERQRALDDARMLNGLREQALDQMRQQYLLGCSGALAQTAK